MEKQLEEEDDRMEAFTIKTNRNRVYADALRQQKNKLENQSSSVESIRRALRGKISCEDQIAVRLKQIENRLMEEAAGMERFSQALEVITGYYMQTEKEICGAGGSVVTNIQENMQDAYMRYEISEILKEDEFSEERWEQASLPERKQILQDLQDRIEKVMGIDIADIQYRTDWDDTIVGGYQFDKNVIGINEKILETGSMGFLAGSLEHEMRHAYQDAVCENPDGFMVSEKTIASWQENMDHYEENLRNGIYADQILEKDARQFANQGEMQTGVLGNIAQMDGSTMYFWNPFQPKKITLKEAIQRSGVNPNNYNTYNEYANAFGIGGMGKQGTDKNYQLSSEEFAKLNSGVPFGYTESTYFGEPSSVTKSNTDNGDYDGMDWVLDKLESIPFVGAPAGTREWYDAVKHGDKEQAAESLTKMTTNIAIGEADDYHVMDVVNYGTEKWSQSKWNPCNWFK